jgi:hypothetical protein
MAIEYMVCGFSRKYGYRARVEHFSLATVCYDQTPIQP